MMNVEQYVMAYGIEQDRIRAILPDRFASPRIEIEFTENDAHGESIGKTLPAYPEEVKTIYPRQELTVKEKIWYTHAITNRS